MINNRGSEMGVQSELKSCNMCYDYKIRVWSVIISVWLAAQQRVTTITSASCTFDLHDATSQIKDQARYDIRLIRTETAASLLLKRAAPARPPLWSPHLWSKAFISLTSALQRPPDTKLLPLPRRPQLSCFQAVNIKDEVFPTCTQEAGKFTTAVI